VQLLPDPPDVSRDWGHSSAGRAPALQAGGRRFDPDWLHQSLKPAAPELIHSFNRSGFTPGLLFKNAKFSSENECLFLIENVAFAN
jgi:hypothetical protein